MSCTECAVKRFRCSSSEAVKKAALSKKTNIQNESSTPSGFYASRLQSCGRETRRLHSRHVLLGYLRLLWALALLVLAYLCFVRHALAWEWLFVPCLAFAVTARWHGRVLRASTQSRRAERFYEHGLTRLEDRWAGVRPRTTRVDLTNSLYAADLDLFGPGSLFELLCTARTTPGEDMLANWLLHPASPDEIRTRQAAVSDLQPRTALREALASVPGPDLLKIDRDGLIAWGETQTKPLPNALRWLAPLLVVLTLAAVVQSAVTHSLVAIAGMLLLNRSVTFFYQHRLNPLFAGAEQASRRLSVMAELLLAVEREPFDTPALQALQAKLGRGQQTASSAIRRLSTLAAGVEQRANYMIRIFDLFSLYSVQLGLFVQIWRRRHGAHLRSWLDTLGELEALLSFSAFHFEHPQDSFPEICPAEVVFAATALGHPLLPASACVRNDVTLDETTRMLLISGSNMSGKSTLLRAVGTATVMAMAGAPVRARHLRLGPLQVAASIQINDSLQSGRSHFYAEILRLREVCELARMHPPVLFLLDELLAGTNSHDRLAGATGVVRELLASGALGLLSTHDLALTEISGPEEDLIHNAHFEDSVSEGKLHFDYTLREGVVTRSNGLALMRLIGLDV